MGKRAASFCLIRLFCCLSLVVAVLAQPARASCRSDAIDIRASQADAPSARFTIELADTPELQQKGLMFRETMPRSAGMLFVYPRPSRAVYWMKNTLIPLDMIFADATGTVTHVHENAIPHDESPIDGGDNVSAVLEINGGLARKLGIKPGSQMRHEIFSENLSVWPCN